MFKRRYPAFGREALIDGIDLGETDVQQVRAPPSRRYIRLEGVDMKTASSVAVCLLALLSLNHAATAAGDLRSTGDGSNVNLVGRWAKGPCFATAAIDSVAYFGDGAILRIVDFSAPAAPIQIGELTLPGPIFDIQIEGDYAYIANYEDGLRVVDISSPASPAEVGFFDTAGTSYNIAISGDHLFLADGTNGMRIIDITDPTMPGEVGSVPTDRSILAVAASGDHAYHAGYWGDLHILDVTNPAAPIETSVFDLSGDSYGMTMSGNFVFVAHSQFLTVIDVTDPGNPFQPDNDLLSGTAMSVTMSGEHAFVGASDGGLEIVHFSMVDTTLTWIARFDTEGMASDAAVGGELAFVSDRSEGLRVVDIATIADPAELGSFETAGQIQSVAVANNLAFLGDRQRGLHIVDFLNRSNPVRIGHHDTAGTMLDVAVRDDYAYIADNEEGLRVIDISDPSDPFEAGSLPISHYASYIALRGDYAYVSEGFSGLRVVDISTPTSPTTAGIVDPATGSAYRAALNSTHAFVAKGTHGFSVIDISVPAAPTEVGFFDPVDYEASIWGLDVAGDYVYLADHAKDRLYVIDISNPASPTQVNIVETEFRPEDIFVHNGFAYVACYNSGLRVFDLGDPALPVEVGYYDTGDQAYALTVAGTNLLVADDQDGLWVLDNSLATPVLLSNFSAIDVGGAVALSWELQDAGTMAQFRLMRYWDGKEAELDWTRDAPGHFSAIDSDALLREGGRFVYRLHGREADEMWQLLRSETIELSPSAPSSLVLNARPNPFNPRTELSFDLAGPEIATLTIYDPAGRKVATLLDHAACEAGRQVVTWTGHDDFGHGLSSGVYLARVVAGNLRAESKLVLLR